MKCGNSCRLFGAYEALAGIKDNVVLIHSVVGCHFGTMSFHVNNDMTDMRATCTIINDSDIIFNGENSLKKAMNYVIELYNPKSITVITGCVSQIIGDDVEKIISEFSHKVKCIHINGAGFKGDFEEGYEDALLGLYSKLGKKTENSKEPSINIIGMLYDDFKRNADIEELRRILERKVKINCIVGDCTLEEFENLNNASLNVVFNRGIALAKYMEEKFSKPFINIEYPYGIEGMKNLLQCVSEKLNISFEKEKIEMEEETIKTISKIYSYLKSFYGLPVCVVGSKARAEGMKKVLENELGMEVVSFAINSPQLSMEDFIKDTLKTDSALVFGSSFQGDIADKLGVPLIRYEYPTFDRIAITNNPYIGGRGIVNLVEDILNIIINARENKGGLYNEKNMHLW